MLRLWMLLCAIERTVLAASNLNFMAMNKFTTAEEIANLRWDSLTHLGQANNTLVLDAKGNVAPMDPAAWPGKALIAAAHGNDSLIYVGLHPTSKPDMVSLFASSAADITAAGKAAATAAMEGGYDGLQIDIEGLQQVIQLHCCTL